MTIAKSNVKMMSSQDLSDNDQAGGVMTNVEIVDGNVNNLFPDISRLDRTTGRVSLRKGFITIQTNTQETYFGSHAILTDPPDDPGVSVTIFSTDSYTDQRSNAQDKIESYVVRGVLTRFRVWDNQLQGQKTVLLMGYPDVEIPEIGEVFVLVQDEGQGSEFEQFVRITAIEEETQTFFDSSGSYDLRVVTASISDAIRQTFNGGVPNRFDTASQSGDPAVFRKTTVADASNYFGVTPLSVDITQNDLSFKVDSIFANLVPSSQSETPLADFQAGGDTGRFVQSRSSTITVTIKPDDLGTIVYMGAGILPGSLLINDDVQSTQWQDNADGTTTKTGVGPGGFTIIDYALGRIDIADLNKGNRDIDFIFNTAAKITDVSNTDQIAITIQNRGLTFVKTLWPIPVPGSLIIDYMALGKWYRMRDNGNGEVFGDVDGIGTGQINFATGTVTITLAALPDADTSILFGWGGDNHYSIRTGFDTPSQPIIQHQLATPVFPGSLTISWLSGAVAKTATDDGVGNITGDATGVIQYVNGQFYLAPTLLIDANSDITIDYTEDTLFTENFVLDDTAGVINFTLTNLPVKQGSIEVSFDVDVNTQYFAVIPDRAYDANVTDQITVVNGISIPGTYNASIGLTSVRRTLRDDGAGIFNNAGDSINYGTGVCSANVLDSTLTGNAFNGQQLIQAWEETVVNETFGNQTVTVKYAKSDGTPTVKQEIIQPPPLVIDLLPTVSDAIIPSSLVFTLGGEQYIDRSGNLFKEIDFNTNFGTLAGTIDYDSGICTITNWTGGGSADIAIRALLSQFGDWSFYEASFRTTGSPLKPLSFFISGNKVSDGSLISSTADANGNLSTNDITGTINVTNGVANVKFGRYVVAAGNESEPWYDVEELDGLGNVWQPEHVLPTTLKYNAVVFSYLPVDAELIGIDPVRLPQDGRVPIFRPGNVIVVHATTTELAPDNLTASQVISVTGGPYTLMELYDQLDVQVDPDLYTVDLALGQVTMATPLDLSAYTEPLIVVKRIEDMVLLTDAQINGELTVNSPITHDYTAAGATFVSSALTFGDLGSRYYGLVEQETWTGVWSDSIIGNPTTAQYNESLYPILIANDGAITERWALIFTSSTTFNIVGEMIGIIGTGATTDAPGSFTAPNNPATGQPYFEIQQDGWGVGWSTGNVVRFNTDSATAPVWFNRTTLPGPETEPTDEFTIQIRGDAN